MTRPEHPEGGVSFDLAAMERELRREDAYQREGHTARTLVREQDLRVVLVALRAGARIGEHHASQTVSVLPLSGHVRLRLETETVELMPGRLLVLEKGLRHDVEALQESAMLLTLGWKGP